MGSRAPLRYSRIHLDAIQGHWSVEVRPKYTVWSPRKRRWALSIICSSSSWLWKKVQYIFCKHCFPSLLWPSAHDYAYQKCLRVGKLVKHINTECESMLHWRFVLIYRVHSSETSRYVYNYSCGFQESIQQSSFAVNLSWFLRNFSQCVGLHFISPSVSLSLTLLEIPHAHVACSVSVVMISRLMLNLQNPALFGTHYTTDSTIGPFVAIAGSSRRQSASFAISQRLESIDEMTENPSRHPEWTWTPSPRDSQRTTNTTPVS